MPVMCYLNSHALPDIIGSFLFPNSRRSILLLLEFMFRSIWEGALCAWLCLRAHGQKQAWFCCTPLPASLAASQKRCLWAGAQVPYQIQRPRKKKERRSWWGETRGGHAAANKHTGLPPPMPGSTCEMAITGLGFAATCCHSPIVCPSNHPSDGGGCTFKLKL